MPYLLFLKKRKKCNCNCRLLQIIGGALSLTERMENEVTSQENDDAVCPDSEWIRRWQDDEAHWHKQNIDP